MVSSPPCTCGADACTCAASVSVENNNKMIKLMQFLMGLNDVYMPIRSNILLRDPLPDVKAAYAIISREESHRINSSKDSSSKPHSSAFVAQGPIKTNANNASNFNNNRGPNPNLKCKKCNKIGHTIERCFELVGYPPNFKKNFNNNRNFNNFNNFGNTSNNNAASNEASISSSSPISFSLEQMLKLLNLIKEPSTSAPASAMSNMEVGHPNGTQALIKGIGNLVLNKFITLTDVLIVPEYCVSLMSVGKLSKDNKLIVSFNESKCYVQDLKDKIIREIGKEEGGLYFFDNKVDSKVSDIKCIVSSCSASCKLWHSRLGHPSDQVLAILKNKLNITDKINNDPCEVCHKAKQSRIFFSLSEHKTSNLGDLIHLDLWGPFRVQSREGYKYFLTIVDDYSRAVWLFLVKSKEEVCDNIISFVQLLETQFNKKVKMFRSDNGTEFVNQKMNNFTNNKGIIHQTTCSYTPQQNGVVERKHRHLLNVARALMFQGGLPLNLWSKCVLTACYLINRTPTSVFNGKSPYELVFKTEPNLSHLKCFGCLCFSVSLNPVDKFSSSINLFDDLFKTTNNTSSPNDEGRVTNECDGNSDNEQSPVHNPAATHNEGNPLSPEGTHSSESQNINELRRSSRSTVFPKKYDDFVVDGKVKYGIEKVVNYSNLSKDIIALFHT
ncbi:uncharacterized protein [Rutidosis leptorrhynchoides]|uniref:uncharacterized protein n=1 Tax=Rutidosis leptorrhynchoides TaxID=125765 RepID=UPI003A999CB2